MIDRIRSQDDLRLIAAFGATQSKDAYEKVWTALNEEVGEIYVWRPIVRDFNVTSGDDLDPEFDRAALRALAAKYGAVKTKEE